MSVRTDFVAAAILVAATSSGCASITTGHYQSLSVETRAQGIAVTDAACRLQNNKGSWFVRSPGSVVVHRSYQDLVVSCTHEKNEPGSIVVQSSTKPMVFGNILIGGAIGAGVDIGTGAAYDYPQLITVELGMSQAPPQAVPVKQ